MSRVNIIRSFCGWALLVLFTFSITPRQVLHDVLAHHVDVAKVDLAEQSASLTKKGFSCDRLNLVAESPFTSTHKHIEFITPHQYIEFSVADTNGIPFISITLPSLRGPPCI